MQLFGKLWNTTPTSLSRRKSPVSVSGLPQVTSPHTTFTMTPLNVITSNVSEYQLLLIELNAYSKGSLSDVFSC